MPGESADLHAFQTVSAIGNFCSAMILVLLGRRRLTAGTHMQAFVDVKVAVEAVQLATPFVTPQHHPSLNNTQSSHECR